MTSKSTSLVEAAAAEMRELRLKLGWSTATLAERARLIAERYGDMISLSQQTISQFEQGRAKRMPSWIRYVEEATTEGINDELRRQTDEDFHLSAASVFVEALPTYAGAGGGGTGDGEVERASFSRSLVEYELRAKPTDLLAIQIEGNSMSPDFQSGDQLLVDKRKTSLAQPGAFCLWDGDGYVVKYIEKVHDSEPQKVRVISANQIYSTVERLADEVRILGRVVWFARRV